MIHGTYRIVLKTLMGRKSGRLTLYENDHVLTGFMEILGYRTEIHDGVLDDGRCRISGEFITPVRTIAFTAEGSVDEKAVSLNVKAGGLGLYLSGEIAADSEKGG